MSLDRLSRSLTIAIALAGAACGDRGAAPPEEAPQAPMPLGTMPPTTIVAAPAVAGFEQRPERQATGDMPHRTAAAPAPAAQPAPAGQPAVPDTPPAVSPLKLIRTAQVALEVPSYEKAADAVRAAAEAHGGYVADVRGARAAGDRRSGSITMRVPAERFTSAVAAVKALGKVRSEAVSAQDVTKAYADLATRLAVKREAAQRVRDILKMRTADLSDVLEAERELARLTELIEQMEGERRYYDNLIALSTITVALEEPGPVVATGVFEPIGEALHDSVDVLSRSVAALVYLAVFLTPWVLVVLLLWRVVRRVRRGRVGRGVERPKVEDPAAGK